MNIFSDLEFVSNGAYGCEDTHLSRWLLAGIWAAGEASNTRELSQTLLFGRLKSFFFWLSLYGVSKDSKDKAKTLMMIA